MKYVEECIDFRYYVKHYITPNHYTSLIQRLHIQFINKSNKDYESLCTFERKAKYKSIYP